MKVGLYQFHVAKGQPQENRDKIARALKGHSFDLLVLPELCTSGYFLTQEELCSLAEPVPNGDTTQYFLDMARKYDAYFVAGLPEIEGEQIYNTAILVGPEGYIGKHRKVHCTAFEHRLFTPGHAVEVFTLPEITLGIAICYDTWFPELTRVLMKKGAQLICHPANFGGPKSLKVIEVRAIENMVYTITANRIGEERLDDEIATFCGGSKIVDYRGTILQEIQNDEEVLLFADIDPEKTRHKADEITKDLYREISHTKTYGHG